MIMQKRLHICADLSNFGIARTMHSRRLTAAASIQVCQFEAVEMLNKPWIEETSYENRDAATDDLLKACKAGEARCKNASRKALSSTASTARCATCGSAPSGLTAAVTKPLRRAHQRKNLYSRRPQVPAPMTSKRSPRLVR
ncbi:hypothetical protein V1506DRAFT_338908 [Lipomyces tetrasporus]